MKELEGQFRWWVLFLFAIPLCGCGGKKKAQLELMALCEKIVSESPLTPHDRDDAKRIAGEYGSLSQTIEAIEIGENHPARELQREFTYKVKDYGWNQLRFWDFAAEERESRRKEDLQEMKAVAASLSRVLAASQ